MRRGTAKNYHDVLEEVAARRIYFKSPDEKLAIINDDFLKIDYIKPGSIDLIVTSPPYNVDIRYESFRDDIPYDKYLEFTEKWLRKAYDLVKPDGRMCLNIPLDKSKGRGRISKRLRGHSVDSKEARLEIFLYDNMERAEHIAKNRMGILAQRFSTLRYRSSRSDSCAV